MLGTTEALIIGGIILLLFGAKKLPELAKSLGQSKAAFDEGVAEGAPVVEDSGEDKVEEPDSEDDDEDDDDGSDYDESHNPSGGGFG
uniref:Sec-independent protein translocase protein TatA n=1 Tax=uncultured marine group II/III euryarchaeote KM3_37_D11 TaxID=1456443 RepID=A0A075H6I2_9EURY|nr:hypothetical protein [uncultured marine group II/III euryarchaeote KM3_37_D11]